MMTELQLRPVCGKTLSPRQQFILILLSNVHLVAFTIIQFIIIDVIFISWPSVIVKDTEASEESINTLTQVR